MKKEDKKVKETKKSDLDKNLLIVLMIMVITLIVLIPLIYISEVKKFLPVLFFIIIPILFGGLILYLSRTCTVEYKKKKTNIMNKISK